MLRRDSRPTALLLLLCLCIGPPSLLRVQMGSIGAGASDDGHDAGSCDVEGAVGAGVGGWPAEEVADWLGSTAGLGVSAVADFAGITGAEILEFTEAELAEVSGQLDITTYLPVHKPAPSPAPAPAPAPFPGRRLQHTAVYHTLC